MSPAVRATLFASLFYAGFGAFLPFLPKWFADYNGLTGTQIGLIFSVAAVARIVAGPLTAAWADGRQDRRAPLFLLAALSLAGFAGLAGVKAFWAVFAIGLLVNVTFWGLIPYLEAALLRLTKEGNPSYGVARGLASAAFVVGNVGLGQLIDRFGIWSIYWWLVAVAAALLVAAFVMRRETQVTGQEEPFGRRLKAGLAMLGDTNFALLAFSAGLIQAAHGFLYTFSTLIWTKTQNITDGNAGILWGLGVAAEVFFLMVLAKRLESWSPAALILLGGLGSLVRWTALATLPPFEVLLGLQLLHALSFAATFLGSMRGIQEMMGDERSPTAQMIFAAIATAPAQAIATAASGPLYDRFGAGGYLGMTVVALIGTALALMLFLRGDAGRRAVAA